MATVNMTAFDPSINHHALDAEWLRQATMYYTAATKVADARRQVEEAKQALDVARAEIALAVRKDPTAYGLEKTTEASIEATVLLQPDYKLSLKELNDARHTADMLGAAVASLDHKKKALEHLCDLQARNYWAEPQARTPAAKEAVAESGKKAARAKGVRQPEPKPTTENEWA